MKRRSFPLFAFFTILALLTPGKVQFTPTVARAEPIPFVAPASAPDAARVSAALSNAPVMFIENAGQLVEGARFQARGGNGTIWIADDAIWITVLEKPSSPHPPSPKKGEGGEQLPSPNSGRGRQPSTLLGGEGESRPGVNLRLSFVDANPHPQLEPFDRLDTHVSYFIGSDPAKWRADVPVWGGVRYKDLYPGIDLEITSENGQMVQRLICSANCQFALPQVRLQVDGADALALIPSPAPLAPRPPHPSILGGRGGEMGGQAWGEGQLPSPDVGRGWQQRTLLGGEGQLPSPDVGRGAGGEGQLGEGLRLTTAIGEYTLPLLQLTGIAPPDLPPSTLSGKQVSLPFQSAILRLRSGQVQNPQSSDLLYSTFLGGSGGEYGSSLAVDGSGNVYVTGHTYSSDFPTTPGAFDTTYNGHDAFVTKLNADGSGLLYSTFLGGSSSEFGYSLAVDGSGNAYVTGWTYSSDFPTTPGAFDTSRDGYTDAFVTKLNAAGSGLLYSTFLGGSSSDYGDSLAVDGSGNAYVTGYTYFSNFPTTPGAFDTTHNGSGDTFVTKLAMGGGVTYSISGRVADASSNPLPEVSVSTDTGLSTATNADGYYTVANVLSGTYTLTPSKTGYTFSPPSRTVSVPPDASGQDFIGNPVPLFDDVTVFVEDSRQHLSDAAITANDVSQVGDYFLDKLAVDKVKFVVNTTLNIWELSGVDWGLWAAG